MGKRDLDELLKQFKVQPVGRGYIDCIVSWENVFCFINGLSSIGIMVDGLTWWCHCKGEHLSQLSGAMWVNPPKPEHCNDPNSGCPHGMGGPISEYYHGWFSEMCHMPMVEFEDNRQVVTYLEAFSDSDILNCLVPALWLDVPDGWKN